MESHWALPEGNPWSTPFAHALLHHLDLFPGARVLDIAAGGGIPAFYIADQVGPQGHVLAVDIHHPQVLRARGMQGTRMPWLQFEVGDMRHLPPNLPKFDRITGNIAFMFFRPDRPAALKSLVQFLKPGGQIVLTWPTKGTFDSLWRRVEQEMQSRNLTVELERFHEYLDERPSTDDAHGWLCELGMENIETVEWPLEIETGPGKEFLGHPLLRGGFLDDVYECFDDQEKAEEFMQTIADDLDSFLPLTAQRGVVSGWMPLELHGRDKGLFRV